MKIKKYFKLSLDVWHVNKKFFFTPLTILNFSILILLVLTTVVGLKDGIDFILRGSWDLGWNRIDKEITGLILVILWYGLSLIFYPFMKFWFKNTFYFRNRFPKISLKNHVSLYRSILKKIDETTPDDIYVSGTVSSYGVTNLKTNYSRDTANSYKKGLFERYVLHFYVYPLFMYLILYLLTPILMWFVMPKILNKLQEEEIEGY
ncbi:hypothetical protein [Lactococcus lactis]|uniref:hypothetical protein n=1 Tax=Lactococcus lactis TaxID=1358 RepID=UPI001179AE43|nr:hypothetical protein [Lactococcus lactis]TRW59459.1 hypothetical protein FNJ56_11545 [Lactococcus lactis]